MKPIPAKPRIIIAQVEDSGTAVTLDANVTSSRIRPRKSDAPRFVKLKEPPEVENVMFSGTRPAAEPNVKS